MNNFIRRAQRVLLTLLAAASFAGAAFAQEVVTYYHTDLAGSPIAASDASGNAVWHEDFSPYGERLVQQSSAAENRMWFTGHHHDDASGLTYAGARHYDPMIGRFMEADPAGTDAGNQFSFNRYAYGNNNPYRYMDPDGRDPERIYGIAVGIVHSPENARRIQAAEFAAGNRAAGNAMDTGIAITAAIQAIDRGESLQSVAATAASVLITGIAERKSRSSGRGGKQFRAPDPDAKGRPHSRIRSDDKGVTHYETYDFPEPGKGKRVDIVGPAHNGIPAPHVVDTQRHVNPNDSSKSRYTESPTRPASADETPKRRP